VEAARAGTDPVDPLRIEEAVVRLLDRVLARAYGGTRRDSAPPRRASRALDLADAAKGWMAPRIASRLTLARIARALDCSIFHLCRSFRRATGMTLHGYREQVRVRVALERLEGGDHELSRLALDLGYSSHSHFTSAFKRAFGATPSQARQTLTGRRASF
jgi:AraC-like DNA-binding protein